MMLGGKVMGIGVRVVLSGKLRKI